MNKQKWYQEIQSAVDEADSGDEIIVDPRRRENQPVEAELEQALDRHLLELRQAVAGVEEDPIPELGRSGLDAGDDGAEKRVAQIRDHHAEDSGPPLDQAPRHHVGAVVELFDGVEDRRPLLGADPILATGHHRNQRLRDPCPPGDIVNRRPVSRQRLDLFSPW